MEIVDAPPSEIILFFNQAKMWNTWLRADYSSSTIYACYATMAEAALWYSTWSRGIFNLPRYSLNITSSHTQTCVCAIYMSVRHRVHWKTQRSLKGPETKPGVAKGETSGRHRQQNGPGWVGWVVTGGLQRPIHPHHFNENLQLVGRGKSLNRCG